MWTAIITVVFVQASGAASIASKLEPMPNEAACKRFVAALESAVKAGNPRDIVIVRCEKITPKANA